MCNYHSHDNVGLYIINVSFTAPNAKCCMNSMLMQPHAGFIIIMIEPERSAHK